MNVLWEQDMVESSDEVEHGCITMNWQIQMWRNDLRPILDNPRSATAACLLR